MMWSVQVAKKNRLHPHKINQKLKRQVKSDYSVQVRCLYKGKLKTYINRFMTTRHQQSLQRYHTTIVSTSKLIWGLLKISNHGNLWVDLESELDYTVSIHNFTYQTHTNHVKPWILKNQRVTCPWTHNNKREYLVKIVGNLISVLKVPLTHHKEICKH